MRSASRMCTLRLCLVRKQCRVPPVQSVHRSTSSAIVGPSSSCAICSWASPVTAKSRSHRKKSQRTFWPTAWSAFSMPKLSKAKRIRPTPHATPTHSPARDETSHLFSARWPRGPCTTFLGSKPTRSFTDSFVQLSFLTLVSARVQICGKTAAPVLLSSRPGHRPSARA